MQDIPEQDWKIIRKLKDKLLQKACDNILAKLKSIIADKQSNSHKTYLDLWKTLKKEDQELGLMFDDVKRSTALFKLATWKSSGLITDIDFEQFSEETKNKINIIEALGNRVVVK